jgi:hypothetical protein
MAFRPTTWHRVALWAAAAFTLLAAAVRLYLFLNFGRETSDGLLLISNVLVGAVFVLVALRWGRSGSAP